MKCTAQRNHFELIPTVKMETRHPVEGSFALCRVKRESRLEQLVRYF